MTFTGAVHQIHPTRVVNGGTKSEFRSRTFVLKSPEPDAKYPDYALFEAVKYANSQNDMTSALDAFAPGDVVTVAFYLNARESRKSPGAWYGTCRAVEIVRGAGDAARAGSAADGVEVDGGGNMPF